MSPRFSNPREVAVAAVFDPLTRRRSLRSRCVRSVARVAALVAVRGARYAAPCRSLRSLWKLAKRRSLPPRVPCAAPGGRRRGVPCAIAAARHRHRAPCAAPGDRRRALHRKPRSPPPRRSNALSLSIAATATLGALSLRSPPPPRRSAFWLPPPPPPRWAWALSPLSSTLVGLGWRRGGHREGRDSGCENELPHLEISFHLRDTTTLTEGRSAFW